MYLISKEKPDVLCIQETMLSKQTNFNLKNYGGLFKEGHTKIRAHRGVAIFIHETITHQKLLLNTPLQATAAKINIGRHVTIVSIYNSRSHVINENLLSTLLQEAEFLSKMWSNFRWPLGRDPSVGAATLAKDEPPMQPFF